MNSIATQTPNALRYEPLACVESYDGVLMSNYTFVAYKETDTTGDWRIRIKSSRTSGGVFEPATITASARAASAAGKTWFPWGYSSHPSPEDPRNIQFRVHVRDSKPAEVEMFMQLRKWDGTAGKVKSVRFPWPNN